jgi:hypothetical protein
VTLDEFEASLDHATPPGGLARTLEALWWARKGDWNRAHELAQAQDDRDGAWVHAYLHRVEGDDANAGYWYRRANRTYSEQSLTDEWHGITEHLLET